MCYFVNNNMLQITKGYIQGAFDGEGSLHENTRPNKTTWQLTITNTDLVWLEQIAKYLKARGYHPLVHLHNKETRGHYKPVYNLWLNRRGEIKRYLIEFPPLMASRQKKAAEFFVWDRTYRRRLHKGSIDVLQQAMDIMEESKEQRRLL